MGSSWSWNEWVFLTARRSASLPNPLVAQECEKYGMRSAFDYSRRTYLIGSENTLYGVVPEESCSETELATTIAELFVTGPFGVT
jgi:hypothetical protein